MSPFDYEGYDGLGFARLVKTQLIKSEELVEEAIVRRSKRISS
jgi:hypothetical protein